LITVGENPTPHIRKRANEREREMKELFIDTETYCTTPIDYGIHKYSEKVEVIIYAYAFDDGPVQVVDLTAGEKIPDDVIKAHTDPKVLKIMHNSTFDRAVIKKALNIETPVEQVHDTMIQALSHGLPGGLGPLCEIFKIGVEDAKMKEGRQLIHLFCKPRPKKSKIKRATRKTHPRNWKTFLKYAGNDISSMRAIKRKMPNWNYKAFEHQLWCLDQKINERGFKVDLDLANKAIEAVDLAQKGLAKRASKLTQGKVDKATQRDKLLKYICEDCGVFLPDMRKDTLTRRLNDQNLPAVVRELIGIRLEASVSSTSKYQKLIKSVSSDGRLRGTLQFDGASRTRRWAGRLFQPQNLPRPTHKQKDIDFGIEAIKAGCADLTTDNVMSLTSSCIRSVIIPEEGHKLVVSDLSNIEGRVAAWLAGEKWKIKAFREYDKGTGADLYIRAYSNTFGVPTSEVTKSQRQIGKVMELFLQYEGGVGAFTAGAATYGIDLNNLADIAWDKIPKRIREEAEGLYNWTKEQKRNTYGLSKKAYIVCDGLKRMWREAHPEISSYWKQILGAISKAINNRGKVIHCRKLKVICKGSWLRIILPSGACLCYPFPKENDGKITFVGINSYTRKWGEIQIYGGKFFENICQSVARDVMASKMKEIDDGGYKIVLSVHDELLTEAPDDDTYSVKELDKMLSTPPVWAEELPLAAGGFEGYRYRKD